MLKDKYITCEFDHIASDTEQDESQVPKNNMPTLSTRTVRWQALRRQKLEIFDGPYHDLHYNVVQDPADNDNFYLFSPETIMKISKNSTEDVIEGMYIRKQFESAMELINNTYSKPMLEKVQSGYFNHLMLIGETQKAKQFMI